MKWVKFKRGPCQPKIEMSGFRVSEERQTAGLHHGARGKVPEAIETPSSSSASTRHVPDRPCEVIQVPPTGKEIQTPVVCPLLVANPSKWGMPVSAFVLFGAAIEEVLEKETFLRR